MLAPVGTALAAAQVNPRPLPLPRAPSSVIHQRIPRISPTAQELPNHLDDNCDGLTDSLLGTWYTPAPAH